MSGLIAGYPFNRDDPVKSVEESPIVIVAPDGSEVGVDPSQDSQVDSNGNIVRGDE